MQRQKSEPRQGSTVTPFEPRSQMSVNSLRTRIWIGRIRAELWNAVLGMVSRASLHRAIGCGAKPSLSNAANSSQSARKRHGRMGPQSLLRSGSSTGYQSVSAVLQAIRTLPAFRYMSRGANMRMLSAESLSPGPNSFLRLLEND